MLLGRKMASDHRVYIVDDDEAVRDSLSALLEAKAYAVSSFGSALEFLAASRSLANGCVIADIRMPEMDGLELQQRMTEQKLGFPMIIITGHGDVPLAVRAMKAGAIDFIEKPLRGGGNPREPPYGASEIGCAEHPGSDGGRNSSETGVALGARTGRARGTCRGAAQQINRLRSHYQSPHR